MNLTTGKWYKWVGGKDRPSCWSSSGKMDFMLDGKPHYCTSREWRWADGFKFIVETDAPVQKDEVSSAPLTICTSDVLAELFAKL